MNSLYENELDSLNSLLQAGGPVVTILLVMSILAVAIILLKFWQFTSLRLGSAQFVGQSIRAWREGETSSAIACVKDSRNPVAKVLFVALKGKNNPAISENVVREEAARVAAVELEKLKSHLRGLELIGSLSPLLGLLGTVLGMIAAFQQLQLAGAKVDPSVLSGGIWEALLTTAVGIAVAIPAIAALSGFERKIERTKHAMEDALTQVFTCELISENRVEEVMQSAKPSMVPATGV